jgi:hypothetical protein
MVHVAVYISWAQADGAAIKIAAVSVLFYNPVKKMRVDEGQWGFLVYTGTGTVFLALNMDSKDIS